MNSIFGLFMESWTLRTSGLLQSILDSMNRLKIEFITYISIYIIIQVSFFQFSPNLAGFPVILNKIWHNGGFGIAKTPSFHA